MSPKATVIQMPIRPKVLTFEVPNACSNRWQGDEAYYDGHGHTDINVDRIIDYWYVDLLCN